MATAVALCSTSGLMERSRTGLGVVPQMVQCVCPPLHAAAPRHTTQSFGRLALRQGRVFVRSLKVEAARTGPVVVIDNYDSFTYNLVQYLGDLGCECVVFKNDEKTVEEILAMSPRGILVSPGPGRPEDSGVSMEIIEKGAPLGYPIFGVCMGHQCMGQVFNGDVIRAPCGVMHGKTSPVYHNGEGLLKGLPNPFDACRYHSLVISRDGFPEDELEVTAWTEDQTIMGVRHKKYRLVQGVQFHPESIITESGKTIVKNFVDSLDSDE